jgi:ketosteroid isomerase-like protein
MSPGSNAAVFTQLVTHRRLPNDLNVATPFPAHCGLWRRVPLTGYAQAVEDSVQVQGEGARSMTRSPEDAYSAHLQAVNTGNLDAILKNYADDAVILTSQGSLEGKAGVEAFFRQAFSLLPQAQVSANQVVSSGAAMLVRWEAESPGGRVDDGVDTFVFERGLIKLQTISFSPQLNQ